MQGVVSRELNHMIFKAGESQARLGDQRFRRYHSALLTREGDEGKIFQETVTVAAP